MKNHEGCIRAYTRSSKAWYGKKFDKIEVMFGMYDPEGGTSGEMCVEWKELGGELCARLKSFEDSWSALSLFPDLIQKMGDLDGAKIQEEDFCKLLDSCSFKDITEYNDPHAEEEIPYEDRVTLNIPRYKAEKLGLI